MDDDFFQFDHNIIIVVDTTSQQGFIKNLQPKVDRYFEYFSLACEILEKRIPLVILLGGTCGTGKSTLASIIAARFGIPTALSTDSIRHIMRNFLNKDQHQVLFASTYEAGKNLPLEMQEGLSENNKIIKGYKEQCKIVQKKLEQVIDQYVQRGDPIVIEGVHITPAFMLRLFKKYQAVLPFTICIQNEKKHLERFAVRSKYMTLDKRFNKYVAHFQNIRLIHKWFLEKTDQFLIPKVSNLNIDKSINIIHRTIISYVKKVRNTEFNNENLQNALPFYEEFNKITKNVWSTKTIRNYIQAKINQTEYLQQVLKDIKNENEVKNQLKEEQQQQQQQQLQQQQQSIEIQNKSFENQQLTLQVQSSISSDQKKNDDKQSSTIFKTRNANTDDQYVIEEKIAPLSDNEDKKKQESEQLGQPIKKINSQKNLTQFNKAEESGDQQNLERRIKKSKTQKVNFVLSKPDQQQQNNQPQHKIRVNVALKLLTQHKRITLSKSTPNYQIQKIRQIIQKQNKLLGLNKQIKLIKSTDCYILYISSNQPGKKLSSNNIDQASTNFNVENSVDADAEQDKISSDSGGPGDDKEKENLSAEKNFTNSIDFKSLNVKGFSEKRTISEGDSSLHINEDNIIQESDQEEPFENQDNSLEFESEDSINAVIDEDEEKEDDQNDILNLPKSFETIKEQDKSCKSNKRSQQLLSMPNIDEQDDQQQQQEQKKLSDDFLVGVNFQQ